MARKNATPAPAPETDPSAGAAAAVAEVVEHPGEPIGTDETPETTPAVDPMTLPDPVDDSAGIPSDQQIQAMANKARDEEIDELYEKVNKLEETVNRMHMVVSGMVNMPEHSSLSRPFAARCSDVLLGNVAIPKIQ